MRVRKRILELVRCLAEELPPVNETGKEPLEESDSDVDDEEIDSEDDAPQSRASAD